MSNLVTEEGEHRPDARQEALFRTTALKRLQSPEQLDQPIGMIPPAMRVMAASAALIVAAGLTWAVFGSIPTHVTGQGILLAGGQGAYAVEPVMAGPIVELLVKQGDRIEAGAVIARLEQASLTARLESAKARAAMLQDDLARLKRAGAMEIATSDDAARRQQTAIDERIAVDKARLGRLSNLLAEDDGRQKKERPSIAEALAIQQQHDQAALDIANAKARRIEVEAASAQKRDDLAERQRQKQNEAEQAAADVTRLQAELAAGSIVKAPVAGVIEEIRAGRGDVVAPGSVIATIGETAPRHFEVVALVGSEMGKRLAPGMDVRVVPATVKKEEHGSMRGQVSSVSDRGVSTGEVVAILRNLNLTRSLMRNGSPLLVRVTVFDTAANPSGFTWWSGQGPPFAVTHGTLAAVEIIIDRTPPIALVMPALRKLLGVEG
jgi:HlyD family secretion protein